MAVPVGLGRETLGALVLWPGTDTIPDPELLSRTAESAGSHLAQFLARRRDMDEAQACRACAAAVLDAVSDCVILADSEGRVVEWNSAAEQTFGLPRAKALGADLVGLITPPAEQGKTRRNLHQASAHSPLPGWRVEITAMRAGGTVFPAELAAVRTAAAPEQVLAVSLRDITERKSTEETLRRSDVDLREFFEHADVGLYYLSLDGLILWANRTELDLLGYAPQEFIGHPLAEFCAESSAARDLLTPVRNGQTVREHRARLRCRNGRLRQVLISASGLREDGQLRCYIRDITERELARQKPSPKAKRGWMPSSPPHWTRSSRSTRSSGSSCSTRRRRNCSVRGYGGAGLAVRAVHPGRLVGLRPSGPRRRRIRVPTGA